MEVTIKTKDKMIEKIYNKFENTVIDYCEFYDKHKILCCITSFLSASGFVLYMAWIYNMLFNKKNV